jgi:DNA-binding CsgD family transcriptional regulator
MLEGLLERSLELGGYVLLVCDTQLRVLAAHGKTPGLTLDDKLTPPLEQAVRSRLRAVPGRRASPFALQGLPDFRLVDVEAKQEGHVFVWLRQSPSGRAGFSRLLRERYGFKLRSQQLLALLAQGLKNREIGERLGLRETTVKAYLHDVYETLGVTSRTAAIAELRQALHFDQP